MLPLLLLLTATADVVQVDIATSPVWIKGGQTPAIVRIEIDASEQEIPLSAAMLSTAALVVIRDQKQEIFLGQEPQEVPTITLPAGSTIVRELDVSAAAKNLPPGNYELQWKWKGAVSRLLDVKIALPVSGVDFMTVEEDLTPYEVLIQTNLGGMTFELWPEDAPNHVRNFLDLVSKGFYDGHIFHRIIYTFMIQGGCPQGNGSGDGPRKLDAEFNEREHSRGVLSMARREEVNSASCQFFVCHGDSLFLDGNYTAFGQLLAGYDTLDRIAAVGKDTQDRPFEHVEMRAEVYRLPR